VWDKRIHELFNSVGKVLVAKLDKATVGSVPTVYSLLYLL